MRFFDRVSDLYVMDPTGLIFFDGLKPADQREPARVAAARETLATSYARIDEHFAKNPGPWMLGNDFTMADCAIAPALHYARMVQPFNEWKHLTAYCNRLAERPSFAKVVAAAQPYMAAFMAANAPK